MRKTIGQEEGATMLEDGGSLDQSTACSATEGPDFADSPVESASCIDRDLEWLESWLRSLELSHHLERAVAWCGEMGAKFQDEVEEEWEVFAQDLQLTPSEQERLSQFCSQQPTTSEKSPGAGQQLDLSQESQAHDDLPPIFESNRGTYTMCERLGHGAFGIVHKCERDGSQLAVKAINIRKLMRMRLGVHVERVRQRLDREAQVLLCLRHPNIVQLRDVVATSSWHFLIMELVEGGDLFKYVVAHHPATMKEVEARHVFGQVASGLQYIHSKSIVHRDLKLENILISHVRQDSLLEVKIADFGVSKVIHDGYTRADTVVGTRPYWAPEVRSVAGPDVPSRSSSSRSCSSKPLSLQDPLIGEWHYDSRPGRKVQYSIRMAVDGSYEFYIQPFEYSQTCFHGILYQDGGWWVSDLDTGTLRLKPGGKLHTVVSNFKKPGSSKWGKSIIATRVAEERCTKGSHFKRGEYSIELNKTEGTKLGIDMKTQGVAILVKGINDGLVKEWNVANPNQPVLLGDLIVEVNAVHGSASQLMEELRHIGRLHLTLQTREASEGASLHKSTSYDERADLWSLGVVLYVMLEGKYPFETDSEALKASFSFRGSRTAEELLRGMLCVDPDSRMSLDQVQKSSWMVVACVSATRDPKAPGFEEEDNQPRLIMRLHHRPLDVNGLKEALRTFAIRNAVSATLNHLEVDVRFGAAAQLEEMGEELRQLAQQYLPEHRGQFTIERRGCLD